MTTRETAPLRLTRQQRRRLAAEGWEPIPIGWLPARTAARTAEQIEAFREEFEAIISEPPKAHGRPKAVKPPPG